jgi:hypothetical protein
MDIIILAAWSIWISRNNMSFENHKPTFQRWKAILKNELSLLPYSMKKKLVEPFSNWLHAQFEA